MKKIIFVFVLSVFLFSYESVAQPAIFSKVLHDTLAATSGYSARARFAQNGHIFPLFQGEIDVI